MPVTAGQTYTWSAHSRHGVIGPVMQWAVQWQNDAGANLGTFVGAKSPLLPTVWARYVMTLTAPTGATKAVPWLRGFGFTATTLNSWRIDGLLYERGDIGPYFDGPPPTPNGTAQRTCPRPPSESRRAPARIITRQRLSGRMIRRGQRR
jgi:hypothetical protein